MHSFTTLIALSALFIGCADPHPSLGPLGGTAFQLADGAQVRLKELFGDTATVVITLDPECPFSRTYARVIDSLARSYDPHGVRFIGLYPTEFISREAVQAFAQEARFAFPQILDPDCHLTLAIGARILPEAFVFDANGSGVYQGAIDDAAIRPGRRKLVATRHHLGDVLNATLAGAPFPPGADAVGCRVECLRE